MRAIVMTPGRPAEVVDQEWSLDALQQAVGGFIESIPNPWGDVTVYVNEEGKRHDLPVNTDLSRHLIEHLDGDEVRGTAVVVGLDPTTGQEEDVPDLMVDLLARDASLAALKNRLRHKNALAMLEFGISAAITGTSGEKAALDFLRVMANDLEALWDTTENEVDVEVNAAVEATLGTLMCVLEGRPWVPPGLAVSLKVETEEAES